VEFQVSGRAKTKYFHGGGGVDIYDTTQWQYNKIKEHARLLKVQNCNKDVVYYETH